MDFLKIEKKWQQFWHDDKAFVASTDKAKKILGLGADTELSTMLDEVIPWIKSASKAGLV